ncbi:MAG: glycosyltransferase family 4 protein [Coriobacteriia bacterium]
MPARDRLRILLLTQFYPPVLGGVEVHVSALARWLAERGHDVAVATLAMPGLPEEEVADGVRIYRLRGTMQRISPLFTTERRHAAPVPDPETVLNLDRVMRTFAPDIVHAHNWLGRSFLPLRRRYSARYLVTLHDCSRACVQGRMMYAGEQFCDGPAFQKCLACARRYYGAKGSAIFFGNRMMRAAEERAVDLFIPVSSAVAEANQLGEAGLPFTVVPNFSEDIAALTPASPESLADLPEGPFILQVGDAVPDKGIHVLAAAYTRLKSPLPLVVLGRIEPAIRDTLPSGMLVLGPRPHEVVREAWRRSLFATMPSLCLDACPTVAIEAMASGRAVVASARGGLTDLVDDGTTGFLVPPGDADALLARISQLLFEPALAVSLGSAARLRFERNYCPDVVLHRLEAIYRSFPEITY